MGTYLNKTPGSEGNRKTWTFSTWIKRGTIGTGGIFTAGGSGQDQTNITFSSSGGNDRVDWQIYSQSSSSTVGRLTTTQQFRDTSAWYHLICRYDSTQGTAGDRMRMYLNGSEITAFSTDTNPSQNFDAMINNTVVHDIGRTSYNNSNFFSGYLAETILADGQSYAPTSFGETDSTTGIWKPKTFSGSYGTNGFKLAYKNASNLGADTSGQSNNFTASNFATSNQVVDTPTNNFAALNPLTGNTQLTSNGYSRGNTRVNSNVVGVSNSNYLASYSSLGVTAGKWYAEFKITGNLYSSSQTTATTLIGVGSGIYTFDSGNQNTAVGGFTEWWLDHQDTRVIVDGNIGNTGLASVSQNDIIGVYLNCDTTMPTVTFHLNGSAVSGATNSPYNVRRTGMNNIGDNNPIFFIPVVRYADGSNNGKVDCNFGNPSYTIASGNADANGYGNFEYSPTLGGVNYYALCTENLNTYG